MTTRTPSRAFRNSAFATPTDLRGPLNEALNQIRQGLQEGADAPAGLLVIPGVEMQTGTTLAVGTLPFPFRLATPPGFTPVGLLLLALENLTATNDASTAANTLRWSVVDGGLQLDFVTGLTVNTSYRLTLGAIRG